MYIFLYRKCEKNVFTSLRREINNFLSPDLPSPPLDIKWSPGYLMEACQWISRALLTKQIRTPVCFLLNVVLHTLNFQKSAISRTNGSALITPGWWLLSSVHFSPLSQFFTRAAKWIQQYGWWANYTHYYVVNSFIRRSILFLYLQSKDSALPPDMMG